VRCHIDIRPDMATAGALCGATTHTPPLMPYHTPIVLGNSNARPPGTRRHPGLVRTRQYAAPRSALPHTGIASARRPHNIGFIGEFSLFRAGPGLPHCAVTGDDTPSAQACAVGCWWRAAECWRAVYFTARIPLH